MFAALHGMATNTTKGPKPYGACATLGRRQRNEADKRKTPKSPHVVLGGVVVGSRATPDRKRSGQMTSGQYAFPVAKSLEMRIGDLPLFQRRSSRHLDIGAFVRIASTPGGLRPRRDPYCEDEHGHGGKRTAPDTGRVRPRPFIVECFLVVWVLAVCSLVINE